MTIHASNLVLDELAAGLPTDLTAAEHARTCAHCQQRLEALRTERRSSRAAADFHRVLRSLRPPPKVAWWRRPRWIVPLASVTAAAAFLLVSQEHGDRIKGRTSLVLLKEPTGEDVHGAIRPGEQVSLAVGSAGSRHVLVMAVGEDGAVSRLWPLDRNESGPAPRGAEAKLAPPFIVTPGSALLVAFFSEKRLPATAAEAALQDAVAQARRSGQSPTQAIPAVLPGETSRAIRLLCVEGSTCSSQH